MSKYKNYYYADIKKWVGEIDTLPATSMQMAILRNAMKDAETETRKLPNGDTRMNVINDVLLKRTVTIEGAAIKYNYCSKHIQRWTRSYINLVGKKAGY